MAVGDEDWWGGVMPDWRARAREAMKDHMSNGRFQFHQPHEHDGGRALTQENVLRRRMAARRLILPDAEYAASGVEVIPETCKWQFHTDYGRRF